MNANHNDRQHIAEAMEAYVNENFEKSIQLFSRVIDQEPENKLALVSRGSAHLKTGNSREAIGDFDRLLSLDGTYFRAYHLRGLAREQEGEDTLALADFGKAIELNPEYGAAYYSRATLHSKLGNENQATEDIEMMAHLTNMNIETFANENNVWRSHHMRVEEMMESELSR